MATATALAFDVRSMLATIATRAAAPAPAPAAGEVERLRRREPGAWRTLFDREMPAIYSYAYSRTGKASDAEDLAAQVFEQAWKSAPSLEDRGLPPRAWLFGIARNVVSDHRRRLVSRPPTLELSAFDGGDSGLETTVDQVALARAVAALPRPEAEVITLRFLHGLSVQEVSEATGATVDSVKSRQARALRRLRGLLGEGYDS
jgi:RNA polymerase sigma-70 factor (ECF subfamily)